MKNIVIVGDDDHVVPLFTKTHYYNIINSYF